MEDAAVYFADWKLPLDRIRLPLRYWHGGRDRNISAEMARRFVEGIPNARLDVDPEEGHFSLAIHRAAAALDHLAMSG
jgi:pimeloyl-ACP methyl ester carboxylesterase